LACDRVRTSARGRPPSGGRWLKPTRQKVHIDDLKNPEYRKGRRSPAKPTKAEPVRRQIPTDEERRARFAVQAARAEFGRFYWNGELDRRLMRELQKSRQRQREGAAKARRRNRNGTAP
jgi:hypothetical protein